MGCNASEGKGLAGEPLGEGHIFCIYRQVKDVNKTGQHIAYQEKEGENSSGEQDERKLQIL